jgi:hypothetical protein
MSFHKFYVNLAYFQSEFSHPTHPSVQVVEVIKILVIDLLDHL